MNKRKLHLMPSKVTLTPNQSHTRGSIVIPDKHYDSSICRVESAGSACHPQVKPGSIVMTDVKFSEKTYQVINPDTKTFVCDSSVIHAVIFRDKPVPFYGKILIRRLNNERKSGDIVIPEAQRSTDQSLFGVVESLGFRGEFKPDVRGFTVGDVIQLVGWDQSMVEFSWKGDHYLLVREIDLLWKLENPDLRKD